jgi:apolipoprotein N-acyltransferase
MDPWVKVIFFLVAVLAALYAAFKADHRFSAVGFASFVVPFLWAAFEAADNS